MNRPITLLILLTIVSIPFAGGCATPYDIGSADPRVTPHEAAQNVPGMLNHNVAWGGMIAATKNLKDKTELEVVGYPLDSGNRPDYDAAPIGRFLVIQSGYLETADYAPGRLITVVDHEGMIAWRDEKFPLYFIEYLIEFPEPQSRWN